MKFPQLAGALGLLGLVGFSVPAWAQLSATSAVPGVAVTTGTPVSVTPVTVAGGSAPYTWAVSPALPSGLALDPASGTISGQVPDAVLTPSFIGYEGFGGDLGRWAYEFRLGPAANGALTFANHRLEFTKDAGAGSDARGWDGDPTSSASRSAASYTQSWCADFTVTHGFVTAAGEFASFGLEISDGAGHYDAVMVADAGGVRGVRAEDSGGAAQVAPLSGASPVHLRLQWDAATKVLTTLYSVDGGATYNPVKTFAPDTDWGAASPAGFFLEVFGNSNAAAAITSGEIYGDDLKVSASAPTTYTVTATDSASASVTAGFTLTVAAPELTATPAVAASTLTTDSAVVAHFTPVTASGGLTPYSFSVFPALPAGLSFDPVTGAVSGTPAGAAAVPLFAGSDDFDSGSSAKWAYAFRTGGVTNGTLSFTNGRLDFAKDAGPGNSILGWDGDPGTANSRTTASTATDWVAEITVTNTASSPGEDYNIGFEASGVGQYGAVLLGSHNGAWSVVGDGSNTPLVAVAPAGLPTTVRLRLAWSASAQSLKSYYSTDGGATYQFVRSYAPLSEWTAGSVGNGFFFEVFANSNRATALAAGAMYADNFSVLATGPATSVHTVTVGDRVGTVARNPFRLTVMNPPAITAVNPASAAPGAVVTISGTDLWGATAVTFNGVSASSFTYNPASRTLAATVPASARSGPVVVTTGGGASAGAAFTVPLGFASQPTHNVVTPGQATSFGVIVTGGAAGGAYTYQWRRDGVALPGATSSIYYLPSVQAADTGDYDVVVSDGTTTLTSGPAALRLATAEVWQWRNRLPTGSDFGAVAYGAGRYVAVGAAGTIVTSTDAVTWVPLPQQPPVLFNNVAFDGTQFVVVGSNGNVLRSPDGLTWTTHNVGANVTLAGLAHAFGQWVATGFSAIFTSADGATWTRQPFSLGSSVNAVTSTPAGFLAVTSGGHVVTSDATATTWTVARPLAGVPLIDAAYANGTYVIAASQKVYASADGVAWTPAVLPTADPGIDWNRIVVTGDGFTVAGASYPGTSPTPRGYVIQSADGATWTLKNLPAGPGLASIAHGAAGYVAVGFAGQIVASADGATWTTISTGPGLPGDMYAGATGPGGTLFVGSLGNVYRSADHVTGWSRMDVGTTSNLYGATYANGQYVIVGGNDDPAAGVGVILSSASGTGPWTRVDVAGPSCLRALAFDAKVGRWVAAGAGASIYWAKDPAGPWTPVNAPTTSALRAGTSGGGRYVLVGDHGTVLYSADAASWTQAPAITGVSLEAVAYGNGRFVAAGANTSGALRSIILTSTDGGASWQNVPVPYTGSLRGMMYADGRFVTVGGTATILASTDGLAWSAETSQFSGLFRAILRTPQGYAASGTGGAVATVTAPVAAAALPSQTVTAGEAGSWVAATASAGHPGYTFSISPAPAAGLSFDPASATVSGAAATAAPLFAGADNFDTGSDAKWQYYFRTSGSATNNGMLGFTHGRLDFSKNAGAGTYFLGWDGDADPATTTARTSTSFATSWVTDLTVTNTYVAAANEYADVGLEVAGANTQWASILLLNRGGSLFVRAFCTGLAPTDVPVTTGTGVKLRLAWDATTHALSAAYSVDDGATYHPVATYDPTTQWTAGSPNGGFYFELFGESNAAAAIDPGSLFADDFALTPASPTTTVHTVTVTDRLGLTGTSTFTLTVLPGPAITGVSPGSAAAGATVAIAGSRFTNVSAVRFNGLDAASFTVDSDSQITAVIPAGATSGPVSIQTSGGAMASSPSFFTVLVPPSIVDQPAGRRVTAGGSVEWRTSASGSAPFTYEWSKDGVAIAGATTATLKLANVSAAAAGTYHVRVTNSVGQDVSQDAVLTVLGADPVLWQQFSEFSTEQAPGRTVNASGVVYVPWSVQDRIPDVAGGRFIGALARFNEADGTLDPTFRLASTYRAAAHVAVQADGNLVIAVRTGDVSTVIRTSPAGVEDPAFAAPLFARGIRFVTLQADGRIVVAATDNLDPNAPAGALGAAGPAVFRLNADGSLDTSFTPATLGAGSVVFGAPAIDAQGGIYLAGYIPSVNGAGRMNLARLNADGTLDTAYAAPASLPAGFASSQARAVLLQSDGRAVFVGDFRTDTRGTAGDPIMAIRLSTAGTLDTTFAMPLRSELGLGAAGIRLRAAVLNPDDSVVAVSDRLVRLAPNGAVDATFVSAPFERESYWVSRAADGRLFVPDQSGVLGHYVMHSLVGNGIAAFAAGGLPDESFQTGGWGRLAHPTDGAVLSDGRVWVAGDFNRYGGARAPGLAQFGADGNLTTTTVASARSMAFATLAPAGGDRIFAVVTRPLDSFENNAPALVRLAANGALDATFNPVLPAHYDLNAASLHAAPSGAVMLAQGSITAFAALNGTTGNALLRLNPDGSRDPAFAASLSSVAIVERNSAGAVTMIRTGGINVAQVLPDGRSLVIASAVDGNLRLLRLAADGAVDPTFNAPSFGTIAPAVGYTMPEKDPVTGITAQFNLSTYRAADLIRTAVQMPDGQVYVGGRFALGGAPRGLVRLHADGTLDSTFTGAGIANSVAGADAYVASVATDAAGRLYVGGRFDSFNGSAAAGLFRLRPDGTLDTGWTPGFGVLDAPDAAVNLVVAGEQLYAFGTVGLAGETAPSIYRIAAIPLPLAITQPPVATTAIVGTPATLSVAANSSTPLGYQWLKGTAVISGATSATLSFPAPGLADEGMYSVTLTNAAGSVTTTPILLTVNAAPAISQPPANATVIVGNPASFTVNATGKPAVTYQWYKGGTAIPGATGATLAFSAAQTADAGTYTVRVANSAGALASPAATLTVNPLAPVITSATTASAISGRTFQYAIATNPTPVTFATSALPAGLALDSASGVISGVPTVTGSFSITLQAANATATDAKTLALTINPPPPIINSAASASARVGAGFSYAIAAVNPPTAYGASGLPSGLTVNTSTGLISGTPSVAGTFAVTLSATNAGGTTTMPFVLTVDPALNAPTFTGSTSLNGVQNAAFSFTPAFNTAGLATTFAATGLPAGLTISSSTGLISGTPSATGTFTVNITATNSGGATLVPFTFTVNPPPSAPTITSGSAATATAGVAFNFTLTASGSPTGFTAAGLPALGLTLNAATGVISGTPTGPGTLTLSVGAANAAGTGPAAALVITINPSPNAPILGSASVAQGRVGDAFTYALSASNSPTAFAVTSGTLPAGLSLNTATGAITGTPTQVGQFAVWLAASNASGPGYALQVLFNIAAAQTTPVITSNGTAAAQVGQPFSYQIMATNSPTSFAAAGLPAGLALDPASGVISGLPTEATATALAIDLTATNADGTSAPKTLQLSISAAPATPVITSPLTAAGQAGAAFGYQITASDSPTSFVALNLPAGLALNSATGAISGTPGASGTFNVTLRAANAAGLGAGATLAVSLAPAPTAPAITSAASASGKVGMTFTYAITTTPTATSYAITGSLPLGLALNTSTGVISGTPAAAGIFTVQLTATGAGGSSFPQALVLNIASADNVPVITSSIYSSATVGQPFSYQITAASSPAFPAAPFPAPFTLDAVNLPPGLAVNPSTGVIQGQPSAAGVFTATLVGTNSAGTGPYRDLTIFIAPAATAPTVTSSPFAAAQVGVAFAYQIGGTNSPTSYDVLGAPAWLSINNASGALAGVPAAPGTFTVQLVATNAAGSSSPLTLTLTVAPSASAPVVTSPRTAVATVSRSFSYQITAAVPSGAPAVTTYVATGVPAGLSLNASTGELSGTPTWSGQYEIALIARSTAGDSQPVTLILTVQPSLQLTGGL